jgi:plasmid stabilization system protein ParE
VKVIWREMAELELYNQVRFIARDKPASAEAVLETLLGSAEGLARFPDMGVQGRVDGTRELVERHKAGVRLLRELVDVGAQLLHLHAQQVNVVRQLVGLDRALALGRLRVVAGRCQRKRTEVLGLGQPAGFGLVGKVQRLGVRERRLDATVHPLRLAVTLHRHRL